MLNGLTMTSAVWRNSEAKGTTKLVLLAIAGHNCRVSVAALSRYVNVTDWRIHYEIDRLVAMGELAPPLTWYWHGSGKSALTELDRTPLEFEITRGVLDPRQATP